MANVNKRARVVFFILVVFCLIICAILPTSFNGKGNVVNNDSVVENDSKSTGDLDESKYDFKLAGNCSTMTETWSKAVQQSIDNGAANVNVVLMNNWTANVEENSTSFGSGIGTEAGMLTVPVGATISLELNGMTINRALTQQAGGGRCFKIYGTLNIYDRVYDYDKVKEIFDITSNGIKYLLNFGKLMGGYCTSGSPGGAIGVEPTGTLNMYAGIICDNKTMNSGGGIYNQGIFNMYDGVICDNYANGNAGGIGTLGGTTTIYKGIVTNNICGVHGGGISFDARVVDTETIRSTGTIHNVIVQNNYSKGFGGGVAIYNSDVEIFDINVKENQSTNNSSGVLAWSSSTLLVHNGTITGNRMIDRGVNNENGGGGLLIGASSEVTIENVIIADNVVTTRIERKVTGGGILLLSAGILNLNGGVIKNNIVYDDANKYSYGAGVCVRDIDCTFNLGGNVQIYDNKANDEVQDLYLNTGTKINVTKALNNAHIGIKLANNYGESTFTNGYNKTNTAKPYAYFFSNDDIKIATLNNNEVSFEKTLESSVYDYIYFENGYRKNYKNNNLTHAVNDYDKSIKVNNGDLILGNIKPNTSINDFISKINFERNNLKIYDSTGSLVYDKGNALVGIDIASYDNGMEIAIGTGWKLETYNNGVKIETIYLSVLGDINGDGRISASDITYLRQLANEKNTFDNMSVVQKLASLLDNKGNFTSADAEILRAIINKETLIEFYY